MVWEDVLEVLRPQINRNGYFSWMRSFQDFKNEFGIEAPQRAPIYLSIDFWSQQRPELIQNELYVIRLGQGNFGIFSIDHFPKPYLDLNPVNAEEITYKPLRSFKHLRKAFKKLDWRLKAAENTLLELARLYGVYKLLAENCDGDSNFQIGPRGGMTQKFDLYFKRKNNSHVKFEYDGQVELDYSVWTENRVFVIEGKSYTRGGLDIGWHKLAFPSHRFFDQVKADGLIVNPVYFLRTIIDDVNVILIFLFREMRFHNEGIVLNDTSQWEPIRVFKINLDELGHQLT